MTSTASTPRTTGTADRPFEPIAVVGRGCVLPGALTPGTFWENVAAGRSALGPVPAGHWRLPAGSDAAGNPDGSDRLPTDTGGFVRGFADVFDPAGFALDPADVTAFDPLLHWVLHAGREALREAGHLDLAPRRTGLVLGTLAFPTDAAMRYAEHVWTGAQHPAVRDALLRQAPLPPDAVNRFCTGLPALLAARALNLDSGAFTLDAACASALYAVKLACDRLHDRAADLMLAGAVNGADSLLVHSGFAAVHALSPTGRSRPFHRDADGLVPAEGAAIVALMRLTDALAAGRPVLAVIRGVGLGNDGRGTGFLTPDPAGQERAMRLAYARAGIAPATVGLLECHATGTPVGDAAEIASSARVFAGHPGLPIGSVKSNLGHLLAPAGAAGLLKAVDALRHGVRPPTLDADEPTADLRGQPLRLLTEPEEWERGTGPRRAAVSAFGFGGTNAHVVVEEWPDGTACAPPPPPPPREPPARQPLAVVALAVRAGRDGGTGEFTAAVLGGQPDREPRKSISTGLEGLRFPPVDVEKAAPQQMLVFDAAREAVRGRTLPRERTCVLVGMGAEPFVTRFAWRRRIGVQWARAGLPLPPGPAGTLQDAVGDPPVPAMALGAFPNIVANRINSQLDLAGPSFSVSCEEASGTAALRIAARALRAGEADAALVGAVDLSHDDVHTAALDALGRPRAAGDAAVVLVLKRLADAERDGEIVLALLDDDGSAAHAAPADLVVASHTADDAAAGATADGAMADHPMDDVVDNSVLFGHPHAAAGLLAVATAVTALHHGVRPCPGAPAGPAPGARTAEVVVPVLEGPAERIRLHAAPDALRRRPAHEAYRAGEAAGGGPRVEGPAHPSPLLLPLPEPPPATMPPAPCLPPVLEEPRPAAAPLLPGAAPVGADDPRTAAAVRHRSRVVAAHQAHLAACSEAHLRFLESRRRSNAVLTARAFGPAATATLPSLPVPPSLPAPPAAPVGPGGRPGPVLDRSQLERLALGTVSEVFGPRFRALDGHRRRNRLPAPPLLLIDRVLGIDAPPATLGTGVIRSETDLRAGEWYLDAGGRIPAALLVEAGQANQVLLSWLGIDFLHHGDRVYRALGCEVTFHGSPPAAGRTLRHEIRVDRHAAYDGVHLTFFEADCFVGDTLLLSVRNAQAGLFTDEQLAAADGARWDPAPAPPPDLPFDPPPMDGPAPRGFTPEAVRAFADGRPHDCFGPGWDRARTHTRTPRLDGGRLLMIDRITEFDPAAGAWGRGRLKAEADIRPDAWYFAAHFKNDPCVPGSLMMHGALQAMAFHMAALGLTLGHDGARFEPVPGRTTTTVCRRQATPANRRIAYEVHVSGLRRGPEPALYADVLVCVDGVPAFVNRGMSLRLVPDAPPAAGTGEQQDAAGERPVRRLPPETVDPATDTWVHDHCPTFTLPTLPMMSVADRLAAAACEATGTEPSRLCLRGVHIRQWLTVDEPLHLAAEVRPTADGGADLTLLRHKDTADGPAWETAATGALLPPAARPGRPRPFPPLTDALPEPLPYETEVMFHGPAFHFVTSLRVGSGGSTAVLDAGHPGVPRGLLHQGLLDGACHTVPFGQLWRWSPDVSRNCVAYPWRLETLDVYEPLPDSGPVRCEARFRGFDTDAPVFPVVDFQLCAGDRVAAAFTLVSVLLPAGAWGEVPFSVRNAFNRDRRYVAGAGISRTEEGVTTLTLAEAQGYDWLPGTVLSLYGLPPRDALAGRLAVLAVKDHVARLARVHPCAVTVAPDLRSAHADEDPGRRYAVEVTQEDDRVRVVSVAR
ncbi:beta-ketoacyl synthase N-terminal-like domain-containing protein [Streptomyces sp. NPDC049555]|uniref:hotdog fold thioesterase n=1 Tax=Streptomyces sp. NPDC049555 TaxID=3154930 RepID=UPI003417C692